MFKRAKFVIFQILIAIDQLLNAILGGWADETISSRSFRMAQTDNPKKRWTIAKKVIDAVFKGLFGQQNHCFGAWMEERLRLQSPPEEREVP